MNMKKSKRKKAVIVLAALLWAAGGFALTRHYSLYRVCSDSMADTLECGDLILCEKGCPGPAPKDIVIYRLGSKLQCKRVAALQGDNIDFDRSGRIIINGQIPDEPYAVKLPGTVTLETPYTVPEGHCFVLGDNRGISTDSRSLALGGISEELLAGRVTFRVWPLIRFERIGGTC